MGDRPSERKDDSREKEARQPKDTATAKGRRDIREKTAEAKSPDAGVQHERRDIRKNVDGPKPDRGAFFSSAFWRIRGGRDVTKPGYGTNRGEGPAVRDAREQREFFHPAKGVGFYHGAGDLASSGLDRL